MRTHLTSLTVVAVLLLAGCSAGGGESASGEPAAVEDGGAGELSEPQAEVGEEVAQDGAGAASEDESAPADDRQFVVTGSIAVIVEDPRQAAGDAATLVEETGGFVQKREIDAGGPSEPANAYLLVRIPSDDVTTTVLALEDLGELDHLTETSIEVTEQVLDLEGRVRAVELSITQLEEVLATSASVTEIVEAEDLLAARRAELEQLLTEQEAINEEIQFSTFEVNLWSPGQAPQGPAELDQGFWPSLVRSWNALVASLGGVLTVLGAILPWAVFFGLIGWGSYRLWRRWQRTMAERGYPNRPGPAVTQPPYGGPGSGPVQFPAGPGPQAQPERRPTQDALVGGPPPAPPA